MGVVSPTFSLYAKSLDASLALIGTLSAVVGLTQILSSVPIGMIADTKGRKNVLSAGMLLFAATTFLYTVVPNPYLLFPVRVLAGWAVISTFSMGVAYLGDVIAAHERGLAIGLYSTFLGLGFTVGSAIGGVAAATYGYRASYRIAAIFALVGFAVARRGLVDRSTDQRGVTIPEGLADPAGIPLSAKLSSMVKEPNLLAVNVAHLVRSVVFGAVVNFFPLYAASLSVGGATIGSIFATRALISTLTRAPTGLLTTRFSSESLMVVALALAMIVVVSISHTTLPIALGALVAGEGIAFGMSLTAGQAFVTEQSTGSDRGTAMGIYSTAGSVGSTAGPFVLGFVADLWGLAAVFQVTGALVFIGIGVLWYMSLRHR